MSAAVEEAVAGVVATTEAAEVTAEVVAVAATEEVVVAEMVGVDIVHSLFVEFGMVDT